jgi:hypothetical protein
MSMTEIHTAPESRAGLAGEAEFQEMTLHIRELSRLIAEREDVLRAYVVHKTPRRPHRNSSALLLAILACLLVAITLVAWEGNDRPINEQSALWYLPLTIAGGLFAAAFVNALQARVEK